MAFLFGGVSRKIAGSQQVAELSPNPRPRMAQEHVVAYMQAAHDCYYAVVPLPATNEEGNPVLNGANVAMGCTSRDFLAAVDALTPIAGYDYVQYIQFKHHYAAIGYGPQFIHDEVWAKECDHIDEEIKRLEGIINEH